MNQLNANVHLAEIMDTVGKPRGSANAAKSDKNKAISKVSKSTKNTATVKKSKTSKAAPAIVVSLPGTEMMSPAWQRLYMAISKEVDA